MTSQARAIKAAVIEPVGGHGGMNYYDLGLCRGLEKAGVKPVLYTCDETIVPPSEVFPIRLFFRGIYGPAHRARRGARYLKGLMRSLMDARAGGARIAHFHLFHATYLEWLSVKAARLFGMRTALTVHDVESFSGGASRRLSRRIYSQADLLIAHNPSSRRALLEMAPELAPRTVTIPHGNYLDHVRAGTKMSGARERLGLPVGPPVLLFWGQIKEVKGLDILLRAMPSVLAASPEARLVIAGKVWKDDFSRYDAIMAAEKLEASVLRHIRYIPDELAGDYFAASDLVVLPYRKIYQSGVLLMALSHGRPVVVSDLPGMTEAVTDGETGFVFRSGDPADLARSIKRALADRALADRVAEAGLRMVERDYDWGKIGAMTAAAYKGLLQAGGN